MQIARLQNEKSLNDIVARIYGLKPDDPRIAAATKTLVAENPHLSGDLTILPAGTPLVVPVIAGLNASGSATSDPTQAGWIGILDGLIASAGQASNLQQTGDANTAPTGAKGANTLRDKALAALGNTDIASFKSLHS